RIVVKMVLTLMLGLLPMHLLEILELQQQQCLAHQRQHPPRRLYRPRQQPQSLAVIFLGAVPLPTANPSQLIKQLRFPTDKLACLNQEFAATETSVALIKIKLALCSLPMVEEL